MDASKLTISPEKLRFQKMPVAKRTALRRRNIVDLINSKPYGTPISLNEFGAATQITGPSAHSLLKSMIKSGIITKQPISATKIAYSVNGEPKTTKPSHRTETAVAASDAALPPVKTLGDYARDFAWEHNSDSLRDFIQHMEGIELDIRRLLSGGGVARTKEPLEK